MNVAVVPPQILDYRTFADFFEQGLVSAGDGTH